MGMGRGIGENYEGDETGYEFEFSASCIGRDRACGGLVGIGGMR